MVAYLRFLKFYFLNQLYFAFRNHGHNNIISPIRFFSLKAVSFLLALFCSSVLDRMKIVRISYLLNYSGIIEDVAKNLHEMFDNQQQIGADPDSLRLAIIRCLSLLNINADTLEPVRFRYSLSVCATSLNVCFNKRFLFQIRAAFLTSLGTASGILVPEIVRFCLETLRSKDKTAFIEVEKASLRRLCSFCFR